MSVRGFDYRDDAKLAELYVLNAINCKYFEDRSTNRPLNRSLVLLDVRLNDKDKIVCAGLLEEMREGIVRITKIVSPLKEPLAVQIRKIRGVMSLDSDGLLIDFSERVFYARLDGNVLRQAVYPNL
ncbi:MAG: hypothetical protein AABW89_00760 [Nanoarchaeota archaeon]